MGLLGGRQMALVFPDRLISALGWPGQLLIKNRILKSWFSFLQSVSNTIWSDSLTCNIMSLVIHSFLLELQRTGETSIPFQRPYAPHHFHFHPATHWSNLWLLLKYTSAFTFFSKTLTSSKLKIWFGEYLPSPTISSNSSGHLEPATSSPLPLSLLCFKLWKHVIVWIDEISIKLLLFFGRIITLDRIINIFLFFFDGFQICMTFFLFDSVFKLKVLFILFPLSLVLFAF